MVCGALLAAYLRALASLAVPRHTWALLAKRDALSAYHLLTALARYHRYVFKFKTTIYSTKCVSVSKVKVKYKQLTFVTTTEIGSYCGMVLRSDLYLSTDLIM